MSSDVVGVKTHTLQAANDRTRCVYKTYLVIATD